VARLDGLVAIITGAGGGIGRATAIRLAQEGARLGLIDLDARSLEESATAARGAGADVETVAGDIVAPETIDALATAVTGRFGRIDALVNNAGISHTGPALRQTAADFARVLEVNLVAPFELSCLAAAAMRRTGGGSIVNVASVMALRSVEPFPDAAYVTSKAGLLGLTRELASQWGRHDVRVNALAPGFFASEMTQGFLDTPGGGPDWLLARTPLNRTGNAGELDQALLFLLGPGSAFVTGQVLVVDGGLATR
jgi:NAD(P)-dependent dehydrogenase (short-subunit alcohol dehydrogenase family)